MKLFTPTIVSMYTIPFLYILSKIKYGFMLVLPTIEAHQLENPKQLHLNKGITNRRQSSINTSLQVYNVYDLWVIAVQLL